jgi:minor extracellular serine protease Vpr
MHMLQNGGNMPDQKLDNLLNLALDATEEEREKSRNLNVGYEKQTRKWEIIVKYSEMGDSVEALLGGSGISVVPLLGGYAIVTLPESMLEEYSRRPQIEFIEKPTRLYFEDLFSKEASCITQVQRDEPGNLQLTGRGDRNCGFRGGLQASCISYSRWKVQDSAFVGSEHSR